MNILEAREKIKHYSNAVNTRELYTIFLIIFVGFASFGLGRLSRLAETREPLRIEQSSALLLQAAAVASAPLYPSMPRTVGFATGTRGKAEQSVDTNLIAVGGQIVASRSGNKYHFPWCSGAGRIAEENKIWFNSIEEARKAGYQPASNCKGLR